jgi:hypothetical protein
MNERVTIEGRWWVFGKDQSPEFGILTYEPSSGLELSVKIARQHNWSEVFQSHTEPGVEIPGTIMGRDKNDHPVSLYGCSAPGTSSSVGLRTIQIRPMVALSGREFDSWPATEFNHIHAEFTLLHHWMGDNRLKVGLGNGKEPSVAIEHRDQIEAEISGDAKLVIWPTFGYQHDADGVRLQVGHGVEFRLIEKKPVKDMLAKYVHSFRRLLTLFAGVPVFVEKVYFYPGDDLSPREAALFFSNPGVADADRKRHHQQMPVSYHDIRERFSDVIQKWYDLEGGLSDVLNLYFATIFNRSLYTNQQFLFLAQALEVYHRTSTRFENNVQPKADFKKRKKRIVELVPDEGDWLNEKLGHANEKTLAQRLKDLLAIHGAETAAFIPDVTAFADSVRHTRNHFTHYGTDEENMAKVASGVDLMSLTDRMQTLLEICIFKDLGIIGEPINRLIRNLKGRSYHSI